MNIAAKKPPQRKPLCVAFEPKGKVRPLFFVHIPKTSGSSWNATLETTFGKDNFLAHAEYRLPKLLSGEERTLKLDCVSGHMPLNNWRRYPGTDAYGRMTVLRDPWTRLVSHINWIDRFNKGHPLEGHGPQTEKLAQVAALIARTDFDDRESLHGFLDGLSGDGAYPAFDNLQVRMTYAGRKRQMLDSVDEEMTETAIEQIAAFDGLAICEDEGASVREFMTSFDKRPPKAAPHENRAVTSRVHTGLLLAKEVLLPLYEFDATLYERATSFIAERRRKYGTILNPTEE